MTAVYRSLGEQLELAMVGMQKYYDKKGWKIEPGKKGQLAMLSGKNILSEHRCERLKDKI